MIRFGVTSDNHNSNETPGRESGLGGVHSRWFTDAPAFMEAFYTDMEAKRVDGLCDFTVELGDSVDGKVETWNLSDNPSNIIDPSDVEGTAEEKFIECAEKREIFGGNSAVIAGNHENSISGSLLDDGWSTYFSLIDASHLERENVTDIGAPQGFTFDTGGFRLIFLPSEARGWTETYHTWLTDVALDTTLPVIVFAHYRCYSIDPNALVNGSADFGCYTSGEYGWEDIWAALVAQGNVQMAIGGHRHTENSYFWQDDICVLSCRGTTNGGYPITDHGPENNSYYYVSLIPNAYMGGSRPRANISIVGNGLGVDKSVENFLIA